MKPRLNAMSPGPRPTSVPSGIPIHPTVWPQYTNVTDRTDRRMVSYIGWTVTRNGRPKPATNNYRLAPTPKPEVEI